MKIEYSYPYFLSVLFLKTSDLFSTLATPSEDGLPKLPTMNTTSSLFYLTPTKLLIGTRAL